ncbi:zinc finger CCCH domain-containing protein 14 isoform X2 [Xenopus laevis]|uniref:Zinc finger CCCH domain-containing protein 14 n=1 Tax=Xenopus laevis TaxID=8355 RepID=A0A8J0TKS3_XENLA|nr:zinc finger CCCH domain-containing protein 14 isoform X2 [Xenopus laevis]
MEIGTEISRKIRTAIKGKLQELGAYVDEELPDYIMVMVANKKSQKQMTDDLSLFLGSNTTRFTTWLQGVLDKLRSVTPESNSMKTSDAIIFESSMPSLKSLSNSRDDLAKDVPTLTVSSTRHGRYDSSTSSHVQATGSSGSVARLTSAVKPLREFSPSEAVIDIKLDLDDPFNEDLSLATEIANLSRKRTALSASYRTLRPTAEVYRPPGIGQHAYHTNENNSSLHRFPQSSFVSGRSLKLQSSMTVGSSRIQDVSDLSETYKTAFRLASEKSLREEETSRKRRLPVASSVVKVKKLITDEEEVEEEGEEDEEGTDCIFRTAGISSSVSVPAKPERRPSLPPTKQANKNLILKAISEAQDCISKTTNYSTAAPQKQTVPVIPRSRLLPEEEQLMLLQNRSSLLNYPSHLQELQHQAMPEPLHKLDLLSRLQPNLEEEIELPNPVNSEEAEILRPLDSRSFILKRPKLSKEPSPQIQNNSVSPPCPAQPLPGRMIQPREAPTYEKPASPKFIVTLDGVPSPPGYISDQEVDESMCYTEQGETCVEQLGVVARPEQNYPMQLVTEPLCTNDVMENTSSGTKEKIRERCKYWPACKNADSCAYHHPTSPCKSFPNCRFADKCFFIHPNCKYDAKCKKADCPFTHASKRFPVPPVKPVSTTSSSHPSSQPCRYFPACKKTDCSFYHPKHCRFNTQCTRPDCKFYHPAVSVPARHTLKWTRAQASD